MERPISVHPADETLVSYGLGKLDDTIADSVNKHLEQCLPCRQRVAELSSDSFVGRLREAQPKPVDPAHRPKTIVEPEPPLPSPSPPVANPAPPPPDFRGPVPPELANHPQYEVLRELGRGGMGIVYLVRNKLMDRLEVLKVLNRETLAKKGTSERFLREIQSAARLHHPNVVGAYTALQMGDLLVFAMEYVEGDDLSKLVRTRGFLPIINAVYFVYQAAQGLQHAHERGMIHRDIKPGNLILHREGKKAVVKILDFGLAKVTSEQRVDGTLTQEGQMLGTPDYIAPEQTIDAQKADIRADIYSLGCTLYHLLTGAPPFRANSLYEVLQAHHSVEAKPINLVRPEVPVELAAVVSKMMAKEPNRRYQTPAEVVAALKPFLKPGGLDTFKPELSQAGFNLDPPPAIAAGGEDEPNLAPMEAIEPAERWKSLLDIPAIERSSALRPVVRKPRKRWPNWVWAMVAADTLLLALGVAWATGVFSVKTKEGVIVLEDLPDNSEVFIDGDKVNVRFSDGKTAEVTVSAGKRGVEVKKDGFQAFGEEVSLASGDKKLLHVRLLPIAKPNSGSTQASSAPEGLTAPSPSSPGAAGVSRERVSDGLPASNDAQALEPPRGASKSASAATTDAAPAPTESSSNEFVSLFNGKAADLASHWHKVGPPTNHWTVNRDGVLVGTDRGKLGSGGLLVTNRSDFSNFHLRMKTRLTQGNHTTDVSFRAAPADRVKGGWDGYGIVIQAIPGIHSQVKAKTGSLCRTHGRAVPKVLAPALNVPLGPEQWFQLEVIAKGRHLEVLIEGKKVSEFDESEEGPTTGCIKLIARPHCKVEFKTIEIKELPDEKNLVSANEVDVSRATISPHGEWRIVGNEIRQVKQGDKGCDLFFGNDNWKDYDFTTFAKGSDGLGIVYRCRRGIGMSHFILGSYGNTLHHVATFFPFDRILTAPGRVDPSRWYKMTVKLRGPVCECYIDDDLVFNYKDDNVSRSQGGVGLNTYVKPVAYRDIRVTSPDGTVLFQGLPKLTLP